MLKRILARNAREGLEESNGQIMRQVRQRTDDHFIQLGNSAPKSVVHEKPLAIRQMQSAPNSTGLKGMRRADRAAAKQDVPETLAGRPNVLAVSDESYGALYAAAGTLQDAIPVPYNTNSAQRYTQAAVKFISTIDLPAHSSMVVTPAPHDLGQYVSAITWDHDAHGDLAGALTKMNAFESEDFANLCYASNIFRNSFSNLPQGVFNAKAVKTSLPTGDCFDNITSNIDPGGDGFPLWATQLAGGEFDIQFATTYEQTAEVSTYDANLPPKRGKKGPTLRDFLMSTNPNGGVMNIYSANETIKQKGRIYPVAGNQLETQPHERIDFERIEVQPGDPPTLHFSPNETGTSRSAKGYEGEGFPIQRLPAYLPADPQGLESVEVVPSNKSYTFSGRVVPENDEHFIRCTKAAVFTDDDDEWALNEVSSATRGGYATQSKAWFSSRGFASDSASARPLPRFSMGAAPQNNPFYNASRGDLMHIIKNNSPTTGLQVIVSGWVSFNVMSRAEVVYPTRPIKMYVPDENRGRLENKLTAHHRRGAFEARNGDDDRSNPKTAAAQVRPHISSTSLTKNKYVAVAEKALSYAKPLASALGGGVISAMTDGVVPVSVGSAVTGAAIGGLDKLVSSIF